MTLPQTSTYGADAFLVTERNRMRRLHERGRYDKASEHCQVPSSGIVTVTRFGPRA
jgi:hypothetical protein